MSEEKLTLFFFQGIGVQMYRHTYGQSHDNQFFLNGWVLDFPRYQALLMRFWCAGALLIKIEL